MWAKAMWGSYWNWDPRETSIFFLLILYVAYLALRGAIDEPEKRARLAAVYSVAAWSSKRRSRVRRYWMLASIDQASATTVTQAVGMWK